MIDVKVTTPAPRWPWARQTPGENAQWGPFRFHIDQPVEKCDAWVVFEGNEQVESCVCPRERVVFLSGEPDSVGRYKPDYLAQFNLVVSGREDIVHRRIMRMQQGHPWFVEKSYDELVAMQPIEKSRDVCVIVSNKAFTEGHRQRLAFVKALKTLLGDRLDIYGRGIQDFDSKWDVLSPYRYTIVLENFSGKDFITEKLPDAWLAYCYPFYAGCTNLERYFPDGSWSALDISDPLAAAKDIITFIDDPRHYEGKLGKVSEARLYYLNNVQFFANLSQILQNLIGQTSAEGININILPNSAFMDPVNPTPAIYSKTWTAVKKFIKPHLNSLISKN